jgi:hypothetical protein
VKKPASKKRAKKLTIAKPAGDKEPLKTNVYQLQQIANTTLAPLFPYVDAGSIVPATSCFEGGPGKHYGRFQHFNTVDEIALTFGARGSRRGGGVVRVGPKLHMVQGPFQDPENPENVAIAVVTQRQSPDGKQREEIRFVCKKCDRMIYREEIEIIVPLRGQQRKVMGPHSHFPTPSESYSSAKKFNDSDDARTCKNCGHVNAPFPIEAWGWDQYATQKRIIDRAYDAMLDASGTKKS